MPATQKFMFERSFDPPEVPVVETEVETVETTETEEPEEIIPTFSQEELDAARQEGFERGKEEGIREASEATESLIRDTTRAIGVQLSEQFQYQQAANTETFEDAIIAASAIVRKCFPHMEAEHGLNEIEHMINEVLSQIIDEPRIIITVHPDLSAPLNERMETIKNETDFDGRVVIKEDSSTSPGDCRVEWSNGGADRDSKELWRQIDQIVENNLNVPSKQTDSAQKTDQHPGDIQQENGPSNTPLTEPGESAHENLDHSGPAADITAPTEAGEPQVSKDAESEQNNNAETQEGAPPVPFVSQDKSSENPQTSATIPAETTTGDTPSIASDLTGPASGETLATDAPASTSLNADEAGMEPGAEAGILDAERDTTLAPTPDQSA